MSAVEKSRSLLERAGSMVAKKGSAVVFSCCAVPENDGTRFLSNVTLNGRVLDASLMTVRDWRWIRDEIIKQVDMQVSQLEQRSFDPEVTSAF